MPYSGCALRRVAVVVLLAVLLAPSAGVRAGTGGNVNISGSVNSTSGSVVWYFTQRVINTPASSGPDIAALLYGGPSNMKLGAHNCNYGLLAGVATLNTSSYVGLVGDQATVAGQSFCLFTQSGGSGGTFTANLDWD